jgi:hypothetical protein
MGKRMVCVIRCILILITALMLLDHGPIFVLFIWLYWGSYRRIRSISSDKTKDVSVSDSIRYFSRMSAGSYGFALLMVVVWGWVILQHYPAHIDAQKEYFLMRIWPLVLAFTLVGIGLSLLVMKLSRYRRIQGLCVGFLFSSIPVAWMLGLYLLSTMLSWYARFPYNFTQWAVDPIRFLESYRYQTLSLLDLLVASVAFPWVGALIGAVCSKKRDQTRT